MVVALQPTQDATIMRKPTKHRRVVVTGMSVVTPLGHDPDVFYSNLLEGVSGISKIDTFDCEEFSMVHNILFQIAFSVVVWCSFCSQ